MSCSAPNVAPRGGPDWARPHDRTQQRRIGCHPHDEPCPCHRPGHDLDAFHRVPCRLHHRGHRAAGNPPALSGLGLGRARSGGFVGQRARHVARGHRQGGPRSARYRGHRHRQPARDGPRVGPHHRAADPQCDRMAGPADRRNVSEAEGRRQRDAGRPAHPACCSIRISPRPRSPGCSTTSRARGRRPSAARSRSAPWTRSCCGG